ncbi:MAG: hypothetical protein R3B72_51310 [Polyangiaceae bacterium]
MTSGWGYAPVARAEAIGAGEVGADVFELGDYLDQVDRRYTAFDVWVRSVTLPGATPDHLSQGFFGEWALLLSSSPWYRREDNGRPYGWRAFYAEHRAFLSLLFSDAPVWALTEAFDEQLVRMTAMAKREDAPPGIPPPSRGYQPPPPEDRPLAKVETALTWAAVIAGLAAAGYVLRGLPLR